MQKVECLGNMPEPSKLSRKEFWEAFGEVAPPKDKKLKSAERRKKFAKRFKSKLPEACAKIVVRLAIVALVLSVLVCSGVNPIRFIVSKSI
jgi:hypothetical protein